LFDMASLARIAEANAAWGTATGAELRGPDRRVAAAEPGQRAAQLDAILGTVLTAKGEPRQPKAGCSRWRPIMRTMRRGWRMLRQAADDAADGGSG
jgi:hypothetical protein